MAYSRVAPPSVLGGEPEEEEPKVDDTPSRPLTRKEKLAALKSKLKEAREVNRDAVLEEGRREEARGNGEMTMGAARKKELREAEEVRRKEMAVGRKSRKELRRDKHMRTTASDASYKMKRQKKHKELQETLKDGWDGINYLAYSKNVEKIGADSQLVYEKMKQEADERGVDFYREEDKISGAFEHQPQQTAVENLKSEMRALIERRMQRKAEAKKQQFFEVEDVDYINERNRKFNAKIEQAYGKYTAEIKASLERGTAL